MRKFMTSTGQGGDCGQVRRSIDDGRDDAGPKRKRICVPHWRPALGAGLPEVIIDQHFAERGRIGRLIGAVTQNPGMFGIGIDEDTAIVATGDRFSVIDSGSGVARRW